jgi:hypothetical protein
MSTGLKPCPKCQGEASDRFRHGYFKIECSQCGLELIRDSAARVVEDWNRRTPAFATQAFLAQLETRRKWAEDSRADIITITLAKEHALRILAEWSDAKETP